MIICYDKKLGDGYCDDENNNLICNYDNGDCCDFTNLKTDKYDYCVICECLDGLYPDPKDVPICKYQFIGDKECDNVNNNAYCYYDGFDCIQETGECLEFASKIINS